MLDDKRKEELEILLQWANCANSKYYFYLRKSLFDKTIFGNEDIFEPYIYQREIGFEEFKKQMTEKLDAIHLAEEIHYMLVNNNYDGNPWAIEQLIMNPACDISTAKIAYWRCRPEYYYLSYGGPKNCPNEKYSKKWADLLERIEEKANGTGFRKNSIPVNVLEYEQPIGIDFSSEPYCYIPEVLRYD